MALMLKKATATAKVAPLNLTKSAPALLKKLTFGLEWASTDDLDAAALILKDGKLLGGTLQTALVGYPMSLGDDKSQHWTIKGCEYGGDAQDGTIDNDGFDEEISFTLADIEGDEIILFLTSYVDAGKDPLSFGSTIEPKATLCDGEGKQLADVSLDADAAFGTAFKMVRIFLDGGDWKVENVNECIGSSANGLEDVIALYS